nr:immunoglobulin light chain junction region [Macaca mulatta]
DYYCSLYTGTNTLF